MGATVVVTTAALLLTGLMIMSVAGGAVEECRLVKDVGLSVPNDRMTASSVIRDCFPYLGRLNEDDGCGAWCPATDVRSTSNEWLEIDLGRLANISYIETQGRFARGKGSEYTPAYRLQYDRGDGRGLVWYVEPVTTSTGGQTTEYTVLNGNSDSHSSDFRRMPWLMARRIRFLPYTTSTMGQAMCMRVRLNGCYTDGVVAYNVTPAPSQGDLFSGSDLRFDGLTLPPNTTTGSRGSLVRGLGLLTDGQLAANFPAVGSSTKRGSGWVGWQQQASPDDRVTLTFEFDELRNFTKVLVHTNNQFQSNVRMFREAVITFSADGIHYGSNGPDLYNTMADGVSEQPRNIEFTMSTGQLGRFVKLQLFYNARWILISEVGFDSTIIGPKDFTAPPFPLPPATPDGEPAGGAVPDGVDETQEHHPTPGKQLDNQTIGIIAGASAGAVMLTICIVVICCLCRKRRAEKHASNSGHYVDQHFVLQSGFKPERSALPAQAAAAGAPSYPSLPTKDGTYEEPWGRSLPQPPGPRLPGTGGGGGFLPNGYMSDGAGSVSDYAVIPDVGPQAMLLPPAHLTPYRPAAGSYRPPPHQGYSSGRSLMVGCSSIQGTSGSSLFGMPARELPSVGVDDLPIVELPYGKLHFLEKLGEGQFGEVHLCEVATADVTMAGRCGQLVAVDEGIDDVGCRGASMLVACKLLKLDASEIARKDFQREIKILSRLRDPNIVRVLGMCLSEGDQPLCVIVEYMQFGDLHQFLRKHCVHDGSSTQLLHSLTRDSGCGRDAPPSYSSANGMLSRGSLVYMASQVASGMKYLESLNMVHRDLAARNVLVGPLYSIKISDFGMSRRLYSSDYYRVEGRVVLPIRWMAWESILLGRFTTRSDVWSFGVLLWELFTFALEPPYRHWSDEQVIENCVQFRSLNGMAVVLDKPDYCPREVYDLMRACWNAEDSCRPSFKDIHLFLAHKNAGYDPLHDHSDVNRRRGSNTRTLDDEVFMATDC